MNIPTFLPLNSYPWKLLTPTQVKEPLMINIPATDITTLPFTLNSYPWILLTPTQV